MTGWGYDPNRQRSSRPPTRSRCRRRAEPPAGPGGGEGGATGGEGRATGRQERVSFRPVRLAGAAAVWMGGTFALCYVLTPLIRMGVGLSTQSLSTLLLTSLSAAVALTGLWMLVALGLTIRGLFTRKNARSPATPSSIGDDHGGRTVSATAGGLLSWAVLHSALPGLLGFGEMGPAELSAFVIMNVLESALFGVMLSSAAKTRKGAFGLGVVFSGLLLIGSYLGMIGLLLMGFL